MHILFSSATFGSWRSPKIPQEYLAANWPIRYSSLSSDGRLVAIAGRRGLIHYSSTSGRWKLFPDEIQEQAFCVKGGLLWFHHVLVAAVEVARSYQVYLFFHRWSYLVNSTPA